MEREEYQRAFSWLEPSQEAVEAAMHPKAGREARRRPRLGTVLIAAVLAVVLLTGTAFAANQFHWFSLGSGETCTYPVNTDPEAFGKDENLPPDPQGLLRFDDVHAEHYIGFTLPASYEAEKDALNCWLLQGGLYRRYYRNPDTTDPASPLLTVEILNTELSKLLTRYPTETVKEELLNGFETVWVQVNGSPDGRTQYCLFQKNEDLGCVAAVTSTLSFADAEQAARDMVYADSGIPIPTEKALIRYGFRPIEPSEGWRVDYHDSQADHWQVANATLADPDQDLTAAWVSAYLYCEEETRHSHIGIGMTENLDRFENSAPVERGELLKTGTLCGHEARWVLGANGKMIIQVYFPEYRLQLEANAGYHDLDPATGRVLADQPADEAQVQEAERLLESIEIVPIPIAEEAPVDFMPFVVG